jgi:MFS family permease
VDIIEAFDITATQAGYLVSFNILFLGWGNLFWIPLSEKIGKRPVLVAGALLFFVSSIWSSVAKTYGSLLAARIFQGFGASCSEGLGPATIADLYFIHERGLWMGFYIVMFTVGSSCSGIFAGLVAHANPHWQWVWWMNTILTGFLFCTVLLFSAETNFVRPLESESGEGMEEAELKAIRASANTRWISSLSFTSWYSR